MLNLIINAVEAMSGVEEGSRELLISSAKAEFGGVLVAVRDSGPGLPPATLEHLFDAFYTTKSGGMGIGLLICRSIIEAHEGRVWATSNAPRGAVFQLNQRFTVCIAPYAAHLAPGQFLIRGTVGKPVHVDPLPNDVFTVGRFYDRIAGAMPYRDSRPWPAMSGCCPHAIAKRLRGAAI
jgi:hypothetical protein